MPDPWSPKSLGEIARYINGFAFKPSDWSEHGIPIIRIAQMKDPRAACDYYDGILPDAYRIDSGDLLFSWSATLATTIWDRGPAFLNQHLFKVVPEDGTVLAFLHHLLDFNMEALGGQSHGTTMRHIKRSDLLPFAVRLPPLPEQRRIAEILDTVDEAIRKTEEIIAKLKQVKQGLLHDLLTRGIDDNGELRDPDRHPEQFKDSPLGRIPKAWTPTAFELLADCVDPQPDHRTPPHVEGGVPYIGVGDFTPGGLLDLVRCRRVSEKAAAKQEGRFTVRDGDMLFGKIGTIGSPRFIPTSDRIALSANAVLVQPKIAAAFAMALMESVYFSRQIEEQTHTTSQPAFGIQKIRALLVPEPHEAEMTAIAVCLEGHRRRLATEELQRHKLAVVKRGLMEDVLTGRVRVTPLLEEAAE